LLKRLRKKLPQDIIINSRTLGYTIKIWPIDDLLSLYDYIKNNRIENERIKQNIGFGVINFSIVIC
jgi:hypothetical protein